MMPRFAGHDGSSSTIAPVQRPFSPFGHGWGAASPYSSFCNRFHATTTLPGCADDAVVVAAYDQCTYGADASFACANASCTICTPPAGAPSGLIQYGWAPHVQ